MLVYPTIIDVVFNAMASQEGFWDGSAKERAQRNNNPLNINFAHQPLTVLETTQGANETARFAKWPTPGQGTAGAYVQIGLWIERGMTLRQVVDTQAPSNENDTEEYLQQVLKRVKLVFPNLSENMPLADYFR